MLPCHPFPRIPNFVLLCLIVSRVERELKFLYLVVTLFKTHIFIIRQVLKKQLKLILINLFLESLDHDPEISFGYKAICVIFFAQKSTKRVQKGSMVCECFESQSY